MLFLLVLAFTSLRPAIEAQAKTHIQTVDRIAIQAWVAHRQIADKEIRRVRLRERHRATYDLIDASIAQTEANLHERLNQTLEKFPPPKQPFPPPKQPMTVAEMRKTLEEAKKTSERIRARD
jgi:hypothetical protein